MPKGLFPEGRRAGTKGESRLREAERLAQGRLSHKRWKWDSHSRVLAPTFTFFPWHWVPSAGSATGRATELGTESLTGGIGWHRDDFFQSDLVAKEKSFSLLHPGVNALFPKENGASECKNSRKTPGVKSDLRSPVSSMQKCMLELQVSVNNIQNRQHYFALGVT